MNSNGKEVDWALSSLWLRRYLQALAAISVLTLLLIFIRLISSNFSIAEVGKFVKQNAWLWFLLVIIFAPLSFVQSLIDRKKRDKGPARK